MSPNGVQRCPYCHADLAVAAEAWVVCRACTARHHRACWVESSRCAACRHDSAIADRRATRWPVGTLLVTSAAAAYVVVALVWRREGVPPGAPDRSHTAEPASEPAAAVVSIPSLVRDLESPDPDRRRRAAEALGAQGRHAAAAVEPLGRLVRDPDAGVRLAAVRALGRIGLAASASAPTLIGALRDPLVREEALATLQKLDLRSGVPRLAEEAVHADDAAVRGATAMLLRAHVPQAMPLILAATRAGREDDAAATVSAIGTHAFPAVVGGLVDPVLAARAEQVLLLGDADMAAVALIDALSATAQDMREAARGVLRRHGTHWVHPALRTSRTGGRSPTRREDTFAAIGSAAALPILVDELSNSDPAARAQAAYAIATFGPQAARAIPALVAAVRQGDGAALSALRSLGPEVARAAPALASAILDPALAARAVDTVRALGPAVVAQVVSGSLNGVIHPDPAVREATRRLLAGLGPDHVGAADALADALSHESAEVRAHAARALGRIGRPASAAVPALLAVLPDPAVGPLAGVALTQLGTPHAAAAVPALARGIERGDRDDRLACLRALARLGTQAGAAVTTLARQLDDEDASIRAAAARALAALGDGARTALPELEVAAHDPDPQVKRTATETAARLAPGPQVGRAGAGWQLVDASPGAEVASVVSGGPAARAGLRPGDRIVGVDHEPVESLRAVLRRLASVSPGVRWRVDVLRGGEARAVDLELGTR